MLMLLHQAGVVEAAQQVEQELVQAQLAKAITAALLLQEILPHIQAVVGVAPVLLELLVLVALAVNGPLVLEHITPAAAAAAVLLVLQIGPVVLAVAEQAQQETV